MSKASRSAEVKTKVTFLKKNKELGLKAVFGEHTMSAREGPGKKQQHKSVRHQQRQPLLVYTENFTLERIKDVHIQFNRRGMQRMWQKNTQWRLWVWPIEEQWTCVQNHQWDDHKDHILQHSVPISTGKERYSRAGLQQMKMCTNVHPAPLSIFIMLALRRRFWRGWNRGCARVPEENISQWAGQEDMAA